MSACIAQPTTRYTRRSGGSGWATSAQVTARGAGLRWKSPVSEFAKTIRTMSKQWWFGAGVVILLVALVVNQGWLGNDQLVVLVREAGAFASALNPFGN